MLATTDAMVLAAKRAYHESLTDAHRRAPHQPEHHDAAVRAALEAALARVSDLQRKILFLLAAAGPHRACILAECCNVPTCEIMVPLRELELAGRVSREPSGATELWVHVPH